MILAVYPLVPLPRGMRSFDYETALADLKRGDGVRVPFKGRSILAVVLEYRNVAETKHKLKEVESLHTRNLIRPELLDVYERLADALFLAPSTLLSAGSWQTQNGPIKQSSKSSNATADSVTIDFAKAVQQSAEPKTRLSVTCDPRTALVATRAIASTTKGTLIITPQERDAMDCANTLALTNSALLHGHTTEKERAIILHAWQTGKISTLITTRAGLIANHPKLHTIIILNSGHDEHQNVRRNPRFDARELSYLFAKADGAALVMFDTLPRLEDHVRATQTITKSIETKPVVISLRSQEERSGKQLLTSSLESAIKDALQANKKVLLYFNRKGVGKRLQCQGCGHVPFCGSCGASPIVRLDDLQCETCGAEMWLPQTCPACHKPKLKLIGVGATKIEATLKDHFPSATIGRMEKGEPRRELADITIVTEYFFSAIFDPFAKYNLGVVADLMCDLGLYGTDFRMGEHLARHIARLTYLADRNKAQCFIQTYTSDAVEPLCDTEHFLATETEERRKYHLPPFGGRLIVKAREGLEDAKLPTGFRKKNDHYLYSFTDTSQLPTPNSELPPILNDSPYGSPPRTP
ncbi:hypothetical protein KBC55_02125 [Patescibacteria group bacterium]|nr:hypothetical protein [Patescibacteria group bacterium]